MFPYFNLFGRTVPAYWAMAVVGVLVAWLYARFTNKGGKAGHIPDVDLLHTVLLAVAGALVGAKTLSIITVIPLVVQNWAYLVANPLILFEVLAFGLVFYGGFIGGFAGAYWYCRKYNIPFKETLGIMTPCIPLFHTFGRVGCFLGGCCWGIPVPWGVAFTHSLAAPNDVPLLPVQLIEAGCNFVLFLVLARLSRRLPTPRKWLVLPLYVVCYGIFRFVLEFFRGDAQRGVFLLSTSQWISLALVVGTALLYLLQWRPGKTAPI